MINKKSRDELHLLKKRLYEKARLLNLLTSRSTLTSYLHGSREFDSMMLRGRSVAEPITNQETPYGKLLQNVRIGKPGIMLTERRMLPLAICCSNPGTPVFLANHDFSQLEVTCGELFLAGLPPLVTCLSATRTKHTSASESKNAVNGDVLKVSYKGIAVGLQAVETTLRGLPLQRSVCEFHVRALGFAEGKLPIFIEILNNAATCATEFVIGLNIAAHDAYRYSAINELMASKVKSICIPKGMYNPIIKQRQNYFEVANDCIFSRRRCDFISCIDRISRSKEVEDTSGIALPYMKNSLQHNQDKRNAVRYIASQTGLINEYEVGGVRVFGKSPKAPDQGNHIWLFALHSFADTACIWGSDKFLSHQGFFYELANKVSSICKDNVIVFRPHPNTLVNPKNKDAAETSRMDMVEQVSLINHIQNQGVSVYLSDANQPMNEILRARSLSIVTRWGSAGVEALFAGKNVLCSPVAPYAVVEHPNLYLAKEDLCDVLPIMKEGPRRAEAKQSVSEWLNGYQYIQKYKEDGSPRGKSVILSKEYAEYAEAIRSFQRAIFPKDSLSAKNLVTASVNFRNRIYQEAENEDVKQILDEHVPLNDVSSAQV